MNESNLKNPFDTGDGTPIDGKEEEFFDWERKQELERRKLLPKEEQEKLRIADEELAKRMMS